MNCIMYMLYILTLNLTIEVLMFSKWQSRILMLLLYFEGAYVKGRLTKSVPAHE